MPGTASWYPTVCQQCPAGCGILVKVREGRAKKIEGNPDYPVNMGKTCARGQAGLQLLYNPDRVQGPMKLAGPRGSGGYQPIDWDEALNLVADRLKRLQREGQPDKFIFLTNLLRGHEQTLVTRFMQAFGSPHHFRYDYFDYETLSAANSLSFGYPAVPDYDMANTNYLISFGADFLETWISPVRYGVSFGQLRQGRPGKRGRFVQIEPRLSMTGANADEWVPIRPGREGLLALGMARVILADSPGLRKSEAKAWEEALERYDLQYVSQTTDIPAETISRLAREFIENRPSLAIAGGSAAGDTNGVANLVAINALNLIAGSVGTRGGILFGPTSPTLKQAKASKDSSGFSGLARAAGLLEAGQVDTLFLHRTNPAFSAPGGLKFADKLNKASFIVSYSSFLDESTMLADLILPDHTYLERWGDDLPPAMSSEVAGLIQPAVEPFYNTRPTADLLLALAKRVGGKLSAALPWESFLDYLKGSWQDTYVKEGNRSDDFDSAWSDMLKRGGQWTEPRVQAQTLKAAHDAISSQLAYQEPRFADNEKEYPFYLHLYPTLALSEGRGANQPWMQELPDPMTGVVWGSWVEISPAAADKLDIAEGDLVWVESGRGKIKLPAHIYPAIRPDMIAIPLGQGHTSYGRYAKDRGVNPLAIVADISQEQSGALAWAATRVKVYKAKGKSRLVSLAGTAREIAGIEIVR